MRHLPRFLLIVSGLFFGAGLTSYVTNPALSWTIIGSWIVAAVLFIAGLSLGAQDVRRRIGPLQTFSMRLQPLHAEGLSLDSELALIPNAATEPSGDLWRRIVDWDRRFWKVLEEELPEQAAVYRGDLPSFHEPGLSGWGPHSRTVLSHRLSRIAGLIHEARRTD